MKEQPKVGVHEAANRKRDKIVLGIHSVTDSEDVAAGIALMEQHLKEQGRRCTIERRYVLEVLYSIASPVDIETLHQVICDSKGIVSLTTVYNTLDLLIELKLARRLELVSRGMSFFECTIGEKPHGYAICDQCGAVEPIYNLDLITLLAGKLPKGFENDEVTLLVHGRCSHCLRHQKGKTTRQTRHKTTKVNKNKTT